MTDEQYEKWITAVHEAGHFVMGMLAGGGLPHRITIIPNEIVGYAGYCGGSPITVERAKLTLSCGIDCKPTLKRNALIALAGGLAVDSIGCDDFFGVENDTDEAIASLEMVYMDTHEQEFDRFYEFTREVMCSKPVLRTVMAVAQYLADHPSLEYENVYPLRDLAEKKLGKKAGIMRDDIREFCQ